jgi:hypothetical protein
MELFQELQKLNDASKRTIVMGMMDRAFSVILLIGYLAYLQ